MKKFFITILTALVAVPSFGGTIIYQNYKKEKKVVSEVEIISIDRNIITFQIGNTTRTMPLASMLKYYDTDINMNLAFEDNTANYKIYAHNVKLPSNKKGVTISNKKKSRKKITNKITFEYSVQRQKEKNQTNAIKVPYFYLYVLTASADGSGKNLYCYSYPNAAKIKNTKNYNEALMLEKALSSDRHTWNSDFILTGKGLHAGARTASFELKGIGDREIIAYHLIGWGKDDIVYSKGEIINHRYNISKNWLIHAKNRK